MSSLVLRPAESTDSGPIESASADAVERPLAVPMERGFAIVAASSGVSRARAIQNSLGNLARQMSTASELREPDMPEVVSTGIVELDALCAGLPRGAITEVVGPASSGRTGAMLAMLAAATQRNEVCALIDITDSFDPESAHAAGVDLSRVLWVRCNGELPRKADTAPRFVANDFGGFDLVRKTVVGKAEDASVDVGKSFSTARKELHAELYRRLEQGLRAVDLLLQAGGFGIVALDMADLPDEVARRVPMTTWFRFKRTVENTPVSLLVVEREAFVQSCAALGVKLQRAEIERNVNAAPTLANLLRGLRIDVELTRSPQDNLMRSRKKPVQRVTTVNSNAPWSKSG